MASTHHATLVPFPEKAPPSIGFLSTWDLSSPSPLALPFRCSAISETHPSIRVQCGLRISTKGNLRQRCHCCQCRVRRVDLLLEKGRSIAEGRHIALTRAVPRSNSLGYYPSGRPLEIPMHSFDQPSATWEPGRTWALGCAPKSILHVRLRWSNKRATDQVRTHAVNCSQACKPVPSRLIKG